MSLATYLLKLLRNLMPKPGAWMSFSAICVGETLGCQQHSSSGCRKKKRPLYGFLNVGKFLGIFQESRGCRDSCFPSFSWIRWSLSRHLHFSSCLCSIFLSFVAGHSSQLAPPRISQGTSIMILLIILSLSLALSLSCSLSVLYLVPGYLRDHWSTCWWNLLGQISFLVQSEASPCQRLWPCCFPEQWAAGRPVVWAGRADTMKGALSALK